MLDQRKVPFVTEKINDKIRAYNSTNFVTEEEVRNMVAIKGTYCIYSLQKEEITILVKILTFTEKMKAAQIKIVRW